MSTSTALRQAASGTLDTQRKPRTIFDYLDDQRVKTGLAAVAGKFLAPDRMLRLCINAVKKTPTLMKCDPQTVLGAMMTSAALGLEPNTVQQQAFLIPYKKRVKIGDDWVDAYDCQFQIGARGFVTLAYRSPHIKSLAAEAIHDGDLFEHEVGSETFLRYAKSLRGRGELIGAFSHVRLQEGGESACVLPLDEIWKIRSKSETYRSLVRNVEQASSQRERAKAEEKLAETPWVMWEDDMATKSAIKKHAKLLPIATGDALAAAAEIDNKGEGAIDLAAMADPDMVRSVVGGDTDAPALGHDDGDVIDLTPGVVQQREAVPAGGQQQAPQTQQQPQATQQRTDDEGPTFGDDTRGAPATAAPAVQQQAQPRARGRAAGPSSTE